MGWQRRWDPCVTHRGEEVNEFLNQYLKGSDRRVLLIAGSGFDPRSLAFPTRLCCIGSDVRAIFIKEIRPNPSEDQMDRAGANARALSRSGIQEQVLEINIFGPDGAVVGGRQVILALGARYLDGVTDIIVDISALSMSTSFPLIRYLHELVDHDKISANLHLVVAHDPLVDAGIHSLPSDTPGYVHGFKGGSTLDEAAIKARLWLPQLATGRRGTLGNLYEFVEPDDTCPILPFPAGNPRLGDVLAEEYLTELESTWSVDTRNVVYADEGDPLDLYRTTLRLDDLRQPVFAAMGGSMVILSPLGSKILALGALLAALERDLPVAYIEPIGYDLEGTLPREVVDPDLVHVWLEGDVYPQPRPALHRQGRTAG